MPFEWDEQKFIIYPFYICGGSIHQLYNTYLDMNKNITSLKFARRGIIFYRVLYLIKSIRKVLVRERETFAKAAS